MQKYLFYRNVKQKNTFRIVLNNWLLSATTYKYTFDSARRENRKSDLP